VWKSCVKKKLHEKVVRERRVACVKKVCEWRWKAIWTQGKEKKITLKKNEAKVVGALRNCDDEER
jgi:hypothetical protein